MSDAVSRRSAVTGLAAAVAGAIAGFVYGRNSDAAKAARVNAGYSYPTPSSGGSSQQQPITQLAKVPVGGGLITHGLVVIRDGADTAHAFSSTCTHLGCTVNEVKGGKIFCPCHGSVFNATTGAVVQGPAPSPLPRVAVTVKEGEVYPA